MPYKYIHYQQAFCLAGMLSRLLKTIKEQEQWFIASAVVNNFYLLFYGTSLLHFLLNEKITTYDLIF